MQKLRVSLVSNTPVFSAKFDDVTHRVNEIIIQSVHKIRELVLNKIRELVLRGKR